MPTRQHGQQSGGEGCIDLVLISLIFRSTAGLTQDRVLWKMSCICALSLCAVKEKA